MAEKRNLVSIVVQGKDLTSSELDAVSARMDKLGKNLQRAGTIAVGAGVAIAAGLAAATKAAGDLEEGIVNALTLIDLQAGQFETMKGSMTELALDMSRKLNVSAQDVASGFYQVLSTGAESGTVGFEKLTATALKLTKVTGLVLPQSVERLAGVVSAFNLDLEENVERVADVAFKGTRLALTDLPQLTDAFRDAAPAAAAVNQTIETTTAVLLVMADGMVKGAQAGTSFRIILNGLAQSEGTAADELKRLGIDAFDSEGNMRNLIDVIDDLQIATDQMTAKEKLATINKIAGQEASAKLANILAAGTDKLREYEAALSEQGSLQSAFDTKMKGFNERWLRLTLETKNAALALGTQLMPTATELIDVIADIASGLTDWTRGNENAAKGIAIVALALTGAGGLTVALGTTIRIINVLKATSLIAFGAGGLVTLAVLATLGAIVAVVAAFRSAKNELQSLQNFDVGISLTGEEVNTVERLRKQLSEGVTKSIPGGPGKEPIDFKVQLSPEAKKKAEDQIFEILRRGRERFNKTAGVDDEKKKGDAVEAARDEAEAVKKVRDLVLAEPEARLGKDQLLRRAGGGPVLIPIDFTPAEGEEGGGQSLEEAFAAEMESITNIATDTGDAIAFAFASGFRAIGTDTGVLVTMLKTAFTGIANAFINEVSRMIAKWVTLKLIMLGFDIVSGGAASAAVNVAGGIKPPEFSHGGTLRGTGPGFDTVIGKLRRGETVIDNTTTNKLREFLDGKGSPGAGSTVLEQHFHMVALAGSEQEAVQFGRISVEEQRSYEGSFVSNKRANG